MSDDNVHSKENKGTTYKQWIVALTANLTLFTHGMQAGWVSPMTKTLQSPESPSGRPLTDHEMSWIASSISLAACFGVPLFAYIVDVIGRKKTILIMAMFQALCWIITMCSANTISLLIGRFFAGLSAGACYNVVPMYVREISQDGIRGILGSFIVLLQNSGFLVMFAMGYYMNYYVVHWIVVWIPVLNIVMMLFAPEAPAFLVKKGQIDKAASTMAVLRGLDTKDEIIQKELNYMMNEENVYKSLPKVSFRSIWHNKSWRHGSFLNIALMTFRACSGTFALLTYTPSILADSGVTVNAELQTLSFPAVMILASFISMSCVEKFGRKPIIIVTFVVGGLSLAALATTMLIQKQGSTPPAWIPGVAIVIYLFMYAGGISPMPYIIMAEMFNFQRFKREQTNKSTFTLMILVLIAAYSLSFIEVCANNLMNLTNAVINIRAKVMGAFVTHAWFCTFVQLMAFTAVSKFLGPHNVFYCYAGINLLGAFVSVLFLPETRGKTVEEIEMELYKQQK